MTAEETIQNIHESLNDDYRISIDTIRRQGGIHYEGSVLFQDGQGGSVCFVHFGTLQAISLSLKMQVAAWNLEHGFGLVREIAENAA